MAKKEAPVLPEIETEEQEETSTGHVPQYNVVLHDDDDHTYDYVIEMLRGLFGHDFDTAFQMAVEVDTMGRVVVFSTHKEQAEVKRDQIKSYGPDPRLDRSKTSMRATIEPASGDKK